MGEVFGNECSGYEYLDHTADVQVHAWSSTLKETFENAALATMGYMSDLEKVTQNATASFDVEGHDMESLLFNFLDEVLCVFATEPYMICNGFRIDKFDEQNFVIEATCYGEVFDLQKHSQGTEVKAITYSNLQIQNAGNLFHIFVILDI